MKRKVIVTMLFAGFSFTLHAQDKLEQAMKSIQDNYVDSLTTESLTDAAITGMIKSLDPHSKYYSKTEAAQMKASMKGSFAGIGVQFMMQNDSLYVIQVMSGGPAEKAGLLVGDRILSIDQQPVAGESNFDIMNKIRGEKGSAVTLVIQRKSGNLTKELVRAAIADHAVRSAYMISEKVGYIALRIFNQTTRDEVDKAIIALKEKGMQSLVLDLQGNGGGYVEAAIGVADEFLKQDQLVFYSVGQDKGKDYYYTGGFGKFQEGKLVVLIDQSTASASEILTGALQDWDRAVIVGRRSFGKGLMQRPVPLSDGSVLELTGARYFTPSGRSIQKPYHGDQYSDNVQTRFASGELFDAAVIHFPDSLKYKTLVSKRAVYGGGGIMPDKYVPADTVEDNGWLQAIADRNLTGSASISYMDVNREQLQATYKNFDAFNKQFSVPAAVTQQIVAASGVPLNGSNKDRIISLLALEIKGQIANQLFGGNDYYLRVMNNDNRSLQEALLLLANPAAFAGQLKNKKQ